MLAVTVVDAVSRLDGLRECGRITPFVAERLRGSMMQFGRWRNERPSRLGTDGRIFYFYFSVCFSLSDSLSDFVESLD